MLKLPETSLRIVSSHQLELPWVVSSALALEHNIMEMSCRRFFWNRVPPSSSFFKPTPAFFDTSSSQGQSTPRSSLGWNFTLIEGWKYIWFVARSHVISPFDWGDGCQDLWFAIHNLVRMANRGILLHKCWNAVTPEIWWQESDFLICGFGFWKPTVCKISSAVAVELAASTGVVSVLFAQSNDFARFFMRFQEYNLIFILYIAAFGTQSIKDSQYFEPEHWKSCIPACCNGVNYWDGGTHDYWLLYTECTLVRGNWTQAMITD